MNILRGGWRRLVVIGALAALSACSTSDDPSRGGFFSGVAGISSGTYERRIQNQQGTLQQEQQRSGELRESTDRMRAENAQVQASLQAAERDMAAMRGETERLQASLQTERQRQQIDEKVARGLQAEIDHVQQQIDLVRSSGSLPPEEMQKTLVQLRNRLQVLNQTFVKAMQR